MSQIALLSLYVASQPVDPLTQNRSQLVNNAIGQNYHFPVHRMKMRNPDTTSKNRLGLRCSLSSAPMMRAGVQSRNNSIEMPCSTRTGRQHFVDWL